MKAFYVGLLASATLAAPAIAQTEFRSASAFGPAHVNAVETFPYILQKVETLTEGRYKGKDFPSGLLTPSEMNNGLRDGIADMGSVVLPYYPSDFVETMLPTDLAVLGTDPQAAAAAATEYLVTCAECQAEFAAVEQVYLGTAGTPAYNLITTKPMNSLEDLKGQRIRGSGAVFSRWLEYAGATVVQMPTTETYEGLSQGIIAGTYASIPEIDNSQLYDVIDSVTLINLGILAADGVANVSQAFWLDVDPQDRAHFVTAVQHGAAVSGQAWRAKQEEVRAEGEKRGITFLEPSADFLAKKEAFVAEYLVSAADILTQKGVKDAAAKIERYKALVDKWEALLAQAGSDPEVIGALRNQEIWSKVDMTSYGY